MNNQLLKEIATQFGTPSYIFDLDVFYNRIHFIKELLGSQIKICYAMKANPFLTKAASSIADGLEVCSPGEYSICRRASVDPRKIILSGVYKEAAEIESVMQQNGACTYTAESIKQLELLELCAKKTDNAQIPVLLRVTSGNQFGMDEATIFSIIEQRNQYPSLYIKGLQFYSGTQKKKMDKLHKELQYLDTLCFRLRENFAFEVQELEYGPGFYITYFEGEPPIDETILLNEFKRELDALSFKGDITLEMGRFLAASCGSYVTKIVDTKTNQKKPYCIIDGGIHHINYYGQAMAMKIPPYRIIHEDPQGINSDLVPWTVCGSLCTVGDVLVKNLSLSGAKVRDLLVFDQIGAYSVTEGIYLFLSRDLPSIIFYTKEEGAKLMRKPIPTNLLNYAEGDYNELS